MQMGILWKLQCERIWATFTTTEWENSCKKGARFNVKFPSFSFSFFQSKSNVHNCLEKKENEENRLSRVTSMIHFRCDSLSGTQIDITQDWMTYAIFLFVSAVVLAFFARFSLRLFSSHWYRVRITIRSISNWPDLNNRFMRHRALPSLFLHVVSILHRELNDRRLVFMESLISHILSLIKYNFHWWLRLILIFTRKLI